jgi:hypothetical protein
MSEEEISNRMILIINGYKECLDYNCNQTEERQREIKYDIETLETMIDLYNKEKEKNKKIEDGILFVGRRNGKDAEQKMILDEYIRKDKIKEILKKDRDCMSLGYYSAYISLIDDIQELLYKE